MSSINPFSGFIAQAGQIERAASSEKTRQVRRQQALSKNVATRDDELEHQVESADAINPIHDDDAGGQAPEGQERRKHSKDEGQEPPRLDVKA